jgi:hypothetical protein
MKDWTLLRLPVCLSVGLVRLAVGAASLGVVGVWGVGAIAPAQAAGVILADSVADFSDAQGAQPGQWQYGYYETPADATSFKQMSHYDVSNQMWAETPNRPTAPYNYPDSWTMMGKDFAHPSAFPHGQRWAVRRWISDYVGSVTVSGIFGDVNSRGNAIGRVVLNGLQHQEILSQEVGTDMPYSFVVTLAQGDILDLALDPDGVDANDSAHFTAVLRSANATDIPTPALLPGVMAFGAGVLRKRRELASPLS